MVRALFFTAVRAVVWIRAGKRIVSTTHVAAGFGNFILLDGHVATYLLSEGREWPVFWLSRGGPMSSGPPCRGGYTRGREHTAKACLCNPFVTVVLRVVFTAVIFVFCKLIAQRAQTGKGLCIIVCHRGHALGRDQHLSQFCTFGAGKGG